MPKHDSLFAALLAFQADAPHIPLDSTNPHFRSKFASLPDVSRIVRPHLAAHGLVWTAFPGQDDSGKPTLRYKLGHAPSGQFEEGEMPLLLVKNDPQGLGSAITYARRYSLLAVLGLVGDEDDDGHEGSTPDAPGSPAAVAAPPGVSTAKEPKIPTPLLGELAGLYKRSGWKKSGTKDPDATLRLHLAKVGAANAGSVGECMAALTKAQGETIKAALSEAAEARTIEAAKAAGEEIK